MEYFLAECSLEELLGDPDEAFIHSSSPGTISRNEGPIDAFLCQFVGRLIDEKVDCFVGQNKGRSIVTDDTFGFATPRNKTLKSIHKSLSRLA
uniref:Uncharacterized protein n=1 Tax=Meloidogyne incognita TaxID=6306 RepID=A0A914L2B0_MELIC